MRLAAFPCASRAADPGWLGEAHDGGQQQCCQTSQRDSQANAANEQEPTGHGGGQASCDLPGSNHRVTTPDWYRSIPAGPRSPSIDGRRGQPASVKQPDDRLPRDQSPGDTEGRARGLLWRGTTGDIGDCGCIRAGQISPSFLARRTASPRRVAPSLRKMLLK